MNDYIIPATILLVVIITILVILGIWRFGLFLFNKNMIDRHGNDEFFHFLLHQVDKTDKNFSVKIFNLFSNLYSEYGEKRNDFWTVYGQLIICIFIVCIIALLLLTKVINADAGLPILSAISGFAIAKGSTIRNKGNENINNNNG
jgi:hypothetical protein